MTQIDPLAVERIMAEFSAANARKAEALRLLAVHEQRMNDAQAQADHEQGTADIARTLLLAIGIDPNTL